MLTETHDCAYWRSPHRPPPRLASCGRGWARRAAVGLLAVAAAVLLSGCLRDDPTYNRFSPRGGDPTVLQAGEAVLDAADEGLDEVQRVVDDLVD